MTKCKCFEFCTRLIAWIGVALFTISTVLRITPILPEDTAILLTVFLWVFAAAIYVTGFFDMLRFRERNKVS